MQRCHWSLWPQDPTPNKLFSSYRVLSFCGGNSSAGCFYVKNMNKESSDCKLFCRLSTLFNQTMVGVAASCSKSCSPRCAEQTQVIVGHADCFLQRKNPSVFHLLRTQPALPASFAPPKAKETPTAYIMTQPLPLKEKVSAYEKFAGFFDFGCNYHLNNNAYPFPSML